MTNTGRELTPEEVAQGWATLPCGCHAHAVRPGALADIPAWAWEHAPHGEAGVWAVKVDWLVMQRQQQQWRTRLTRPGKRQAAPRRARPSQRKGGDYKQGRLL